MVAPPSSFRAGDTEGQRFAGAGLGLPDHIVAVEGRRKAELLNAEGVGDALLGRGCDGFRTHAEVFETWIVQGFLLYQWPPLSRPDLASTWGRRSSLWDVESAQQQATVDLLSVLAYGELQSVPAAVPGRPAQPGSRRPRAVTEMAIGEYGHYKILVEVCGPGPKTRCRRCGRS